MPRLAPARLVNQINRRQQTYAFGDTCTIIRRQQSGSNSMGEKTFGELRAGSDCSFVWMKQKESWKNEGDIGQRAGQFRLPPGTVIGKNDKLEIIKRFDTMQEESYAFEIVDIDRRAGFGVVVNVLEVGF